MVTANNVFQLYDYNGCYVSAWGKNFLMAGQVLMGFCVAVFSLSPVSVSVSVWVVG